MHYLKYKSESLEVSPDPSDWIFFAVAFYKKCALWSNDKKLKNQSKIKVFDTSDLILILRQG
ncbi:MAG: PIN domain-containing protein [Candidatus Micrarchaeia archaeon]